MGGVAIEMVDPEVALEPVERGVYDVAVLQKALDLLEAITLGPESGLRELSSATGASKASSFRVLSTLEHRGYVVKDPETRKYTPGPRLISLSIGVVQRMELVPLTRPLLEDLQREFGETVNLAMLDGNEIIYLDIVESSRGLRMAAHGGARDAVHSTALGKALLSCLPIEEARQLLERNDRIPATRRTIVTLDALMAELAVTRERGYSIDDEENEIGARCVGVAVPGPDGRPRAAISISGPAARMHDRDIDRIGARLKVAAVEVAQAMGWQTAAAPRGTARSPR